MLVTQLLQRSRHVAGVCNRRRLSDTQAPGSASAGGITLTGESRNFARSRRGRDSRDARNPHIFQPFHRMMMGMGGAPAPGTGANREPPPLLGLKRSKDAFVACWVYYW
jgi:hypothetical protein